MIKNNMFIFNIWAYGILLIIYFEQHSQLTLIWTLENEKNETLGWKQINGLS